MASEWPPAGRDGQVRIWNATTNAVERDINADHQRIRALAFSPDGTKLASAGDGAMIRIWNVYTGAQEAELPARPAKVMALAYLNGQTLASGGSDNQICIWDVNSRTVMKQLVGHTGTVAALACDHAGTTLVSGSFDTTLRIWDLRDKSSAAATARTPGSTAR